MTYFFPKNDTVQLHTLRDQMQKFLMLKQVVHIETTLLQTVNRAEILFHLLERYLDDIYSNHDTSTEKHTIPRYFLISGAGFKPTIPVEEGNK
jgi:ferric iron reductase protein FhuF